MSESPVVAGYTRWARRGEAPPASFWTDLSGELLSELVGDPARRVTDVGCGPGDGLLEIARVLPDADLLGVDPSVGMRELATARTADHPRIRVEPGDFEALPVGDGAVDLIVGLWSLHWVRDLEGAARELARALATPGRIELLVSARRCGAEFRALTTPVYARHLGLAELAAAARLRRPLEREALLAAFERAFPEAEVRVRAFERTFLRTLDEHRAWLDVEGQLAALDAASRERCEREVDTALRAAAVDGRLPYTVRALRVAVWR